MIKFSIPIKTCNEANGSHGHWAKKASRRKKQREATSFGFRANVAGRPPPQPYMVKLTRLSVGLLDTDALPLALKSIRDQIADELGVTDGPTDTRVTWAYEQRKCKRGEHGVEVAISSAKERAA